MQKGNNKPTEALRKSFTAAGFDVERARAKADHAVVEEDGDNSLTSYRPPNHLLREVDEGV